MTLLFIVAGLLSITGALGVVLSKQPVHQVLATILNFIGLATLYLSLSAEFMAVIQIIIYGGAVMVLFLFVIALMSVGKDRIEQKSEKLPSQQVAGFSIGGAVLLMLVVVALAGKDGGALAQIDTGVWGGVRHFGHELLTVHVLPFELTAFILMVAVIGVVILVGRHQEN